MLLLHSNLACQHNAQHTQTLYIVRLATHGGRKGQVCKRPPCESQSGRKVMACERSFRANGPAAFISIQLSYDSIDVPVVAEWEVTALLYIQRL